MKRKLTVRTVSVILAFALIITAVFVTALPMSAGAASVKAGASGYITASGVNLRSGAGTKYSVITCMAKNTKFTFVDAKLYNTNWYKIKLTSNSKTGYVYKSYVAVSSSSSTTSTVTGYINASSVNLRKGAGTGYSVIKCLAKNTKVTFVSTSLYNKNWYKVKLSNGTTGYVYKTYVTKNSSTKSTAKTTTTAATTTTSKASSGLKISDTSETVYKGNKYVLYATGADSVSWSSSNKSVATVDSNGIVTAKKAGSATIIAKSGSKSATSKITVKSGTKVNISSTSIEKLYANKSVLLKSTTSGVKWKVSSSSYASVDSGIVTAKKAGYVTVTAYTSTGAASCLIKTVGREPVRFTYASPNSAELNSTVKFYAITDKARTAVKFVVSNGETSYTIKATSKKEDGSTYVWSASKKLTESGNWTIKAYSEYNGSGKYSTSSVGGVGSVFMMTTDDSTKTVCSERRVSDDLIDFVADYEGFVSALEPDEITSDPTIGYGKVVLTNEAFYNNLTKNEAYGYLVWSLNTEGYTTKANSFLTSNKIKFNQQQFDALVSFFYNCGTGTISNDSEFKSLLLNTGSKVTPTAGASGYVNGSSVNLRKGASTSYKVLKCMALNTKFTFVDAKVYNGNWYKIKLSDGTTGYIYKTYATCSSGTRDLKNVNKSGLIGCILEYHHAAGSCYKGLLYRRVDEMEIFFCNDYVRDGKKNKKGFDYTCSRNSSFSI